MPTPKRSPRSRSSRLGLTVAGAMAVVMAVVMAAAAVLALTSFTATPGGSPRQRVASRATPAPSPPRPSPRAPKVAQRPVTVVGIGDSVTAGKNCNCQTFVELYARSLAATRGLHTTSVNLGVSGWTSAELLASLTRPGPFLDQVAKADILLVTIGANDLGPLESRQPGSCAASCYSSLVRAAGTNVRLIVAAARAARAGHPATVLVTNNWNVFQDGDVGTAENGASFQSWSDTLTRASGAQICDGAQRAGAICVDLYAPFKGDGSKNPTSLLAADGDHPNSAGHQLIAAALLAGTPALIP